jgi:2-dehydropantoate 2-reductase
VAAGGVGTRAIVDDPPLRRVAERAMREVIAVGNADLASVGSRAHLDEEQVVRAMFAQTDVLGDYNTSMAIDYVLGRDLEVEAIHGEVSRRAAALGVPTPTIDALYALVLAADRRNRGELPVIGGQ